MPRLRQVPRGEVKDPLVLDRYNRLFEDRDPVAQPGTKTGTPGNWWTVFAASPATFRVAMAGFDYYLNEPREIDPHLRELAQTRAGWVVGSQFVFSQHCKSCRNNGISAEKVAAIPHWEVSKLFDDRERAVLAYADCLAGERGRVPDAIFAALKGFLSEVAILELTYITSMYVMHATMARALRLEYDDRDDPVVEIAAPGGSDADFMAMERR